MSTNKFTTEQMEQLTLPVAVFSQNITHQFRASSKTFFTMSKVAAPSWTFLFSI